MYDEIHTCACRCACACVCKTDELQHDGEEWERADVIDVDDAGEERVERVV